MYSYKARVRFSEVDRDLRLTLPGILSYFQDCSIYHSEAVEIPIKERMTEGHMWLLSSWQVIVDRYPDVGEEIVISTWAYGWKGFFGYRNFKLEDEKGEMIAYASTTWIYTDIRSGRPTKIPTHVSDAYAIEPPLEMEVAPRKIAAPKEGCAMEPFSVRKSDIDMNDHVNNEHYVLFAEEYLPDDFVTKELRAEYKLSAKYGDIIYPTVTMEENKIVVALNNEAGKSYALIEFYKAQA